MEPIKSNMIVDAKGLACPMPIVKTKKAMNELEAGNVMEVQATDKGSRADIQAWAKSSGHQYLGTIEEGEVLKHYLRKSTGEEKEEIQYPHVIDNEDLMNKINGQENILILDVRESAEYAFNHIPGAKSIPLGDLDERMTELEKNETIYVVCRTGNRSDLAAQKLSSNGFENVINVMPGMSNWSGPTDSNQ
ncbi:sulfurtransferase TusA family protein [Neobacillus sp. PS3-34]|uniref:sulfurtransferase TusA family protein n=1 Tax=Neobacillus sp. PS3-34 TaxID=3070678 RepID=UPI0027E1B078|nr:sulfurtransferase TusA family protein [Neobacillus sp. PS3-34]WML47144.1 sulfurtransferase TusA family protein [Neobacillus sp. PS3-34]